MNKLMNNRVILACLHKSNKQLSRNLQYGLSAIGNRDVVGPGHNNSISYIDRTDFPMPAVRFRPNTPDVLALREKEKGDWKKLTIDEKKALYRASFCSTFAEIDAPTGEWKLILGYSLALGALSIWYFMFYKQFVYPPLPESFDEEHQLAQLDRILKVEMNPITGLPAKYKNN
ncbi:PREDICTED: cytochrome c oxidase subunit 4 isoform 1, mitochondrial-like [Polistes dominula]|uniref:Cytochrome c oxidase subunit 4 n=1 Tax=Polistes dominula TaxID=743375 RepID=A0ABM1J696_POLDO|nr:PREDICTED: cytochrome c oxidase subunit 4 isoform 1, mitochondrial-like [Polistes dominula]